MTSRLIRRLRRVRDDLSRPLPLLRQHVRAGGGRTPEEIQRLSTSTGVPAATVRGALGFYDDLTTRTPALRICRGTSCELSGAAELARGYRGDEDVQEVHCLGFCHRSPAVLLDETPVWGEAARELADRGGGGSGRAAEGSSTAEQLNVRSLCSTPVVTSRLARGDFSRLEDARRDGAWTALEKALRAGPEDVLETMERSGERGRGGAGYPTGRKWRACAEADGDRKVVVANGDEGDPGSFVDRLLMERDPHAVLEGMALCGRAVGASEGVVFVRSEYPGAGDRMREAVRRAREEGLLGQGILGTSFDFDVEVFTALGSYVCGEETAMLEALEGRRGEVRLRPPYPADQGLDGRPTVVNNVETLANVPFIVREGPEAYAAMGTGVSAGTKALCLNRGFARPGVVEVEFGTSLGEVLEEAGMGRDGPLAAVLLGGPMGSVLTPEEWDVTICYGAMADREVQLGHGGIVAVPEGTDFRGLLEHWLRFMVDESCGRCVPCALGSSVALDRVVDRREQHEREAEGASVARAPEAGPGDVEAGPARQLSLHELFHLMEETSLCAFGRTMPGPMRRLLELAREEETP